MNRTARARVHRVLVFTTPSCPWCQRAKSYLHERRVQFREVNVSRDPSAARDLVRRTGQMGVPVIEIDGHPVVGFDRTQIDRLFAPYNGTEVRLDGADHLILDAGDVLAVVTPAPVADGRRWRWR